MAHISPLDVRFVVLGKSLKSNMPLNQIYKCLCILWETHWDGPTLVRKCTSVPLHVTIHSSAVISSVCIQRPQRTSIHIHRHALVFSWTYTFFDVHKTNKGTAWEKRKVLRRVEKYLGNMHLFWCKEGRFPNRNVSMQSVILEQSILIFSFALLTYRTQYQTNMPLWNFSAFSGPSFV